MNVMPEFGQGSFAVAIIHIPDIVAIFKDEPIQTALLRLRKYAEAAVRFITEHGGTVVHVLPGCAMGAWPDTGDDSRRRICETVHDPHRCVAENFGLADATHPLSVKAYLSRGECVAMWQGGRIASLLGGAVSAAFRAEDACRHITQGVVIDDTIRSCCPSLVCEELNEGYFIVTDPLPR